LRDALVFAAAATLAAAFLLRVRAAFLAAAALLALDIAILFSKSYACYIVQVTHNYAYYKKI
jgi:E3 ubiquitin-protein ligase DOA10